MSFGTFPTTALPPQAWHERWRTSFGLRDMDEGVEQHLFLCRTLYTAVVKDNLQVVNLLSFELQGRQLQMIEERQSERGVKGSAAADGDDAFLFTGFGPARSSTLVCPELKEWISEQLKQEAAIMKERRKAREERTLQQKGRGGGGRRGKKDGDE